MKAEGNQHFQEKSGEEFKMRRVSGCYGNVATLQCPEIRTRSVDDVWVAAVDTAAGVADAAAGIKPVQVLVRVGLRK